MVDELGIDEGLRLRDRLTALLAQGAELHRSNRHPQDAACFLLRLAHVVLEKGCWHDCAFAVNDQTPEEMHVEGVRIEYRPIGPV